MEATSASAPVRVRVIGAFAVTRGGRPLDITPNEQRLVALLAVRRRPVDRTSLAGTLWPETVDAKAAARLRTTLWRCHQQIGRDLVDASAAHVWLDQAVEVDLHHVTAGIHATLRGERSDLTVDDVGADLLEGWFDEWVVIEQARFRQLRLHALDRLCRTLREAGRPAEALEAGLLAVAAEPLRETAQVELINVHLAEGNVDEAVRQYRSYARLLRDELGLEPRRSVGDLLPVALT